MKKIGRWIMMLMMIFFLVSCENENQDLIIDQQHPNEETQTDINDDLLNDSNEKLVLDDVTYYRYFDSVHFVYAEVYITSYYEDAPTRGTSTNDIIKAFYQDKANALLEEYQVLSIGHPSQVYISLYSPLIHLTYKDKESFFSDFELLKSIHGNGNRGVSIFLNTTNQEIRMSESLSYESLLEKSSPYLGYTFIQDSLDFNVLEIRSGGYGHQENLPIINEHPGIIIKDFETYLIYFPENHYNITHEYFDTKVILFITSGRSGSVSILNVKSVYLFSEDHLEIAIETEQYSNLVTMDYITFHIVVSISIEDISGAVIRLSLYQYNHYLNGFLSEVPLDTRPRPETPSS